MGPCALGLMCSFEAVFMLGPAWASAPQGTAEPLHVMRSPLSLRGPFVPLILVPQCRSLRFSSTFPLIPWEVGAPWR